MIKRKLLLHCQDSLSAYNNIEKLNNLYKQKFRSFPKSELFFSAWAENLVNKYGVTLYYNQEDVKDLEFFEKEINNIK